MPNPRKYSEQELVEGCIANSRRHQEAFYRKYFTTMMRMVMRYAKDEECAMEIVNVGFTRVFKKIHTFSFKGSLEGWVRRLIYHSVSEYYKRNARYLECMVFEEKDGTWHDTTLENMYVQDILKLVHELPPATQNVFRLYALEGFTHVEIAEKASISVGTSKWHLATARKLLKDLIIQRNNYRVYAG